MLRDVLARAVLRTYPREFRSEFGEQILADIEAEPEQAGWQLLDLFKGAIGLHLDALGRDVTYAVRRLCAAPLFVAIVVLTFALGIGANVAVFSVFNAVVLRPLPFAHADSLVVVESRSMRGDVFPAVSWSDAQDLGSDIRAVSDLAIVLGFDNPTLLVGGKPHAVSGIDVSPNYLTMLGITPQLGRGLIASDSRPGERNIIISNELWHSYLGADAHAIGTTISLDNQQYRVVGILRPGQLLPSPNGETIQTRDFIKAFAPNADMRNRRARMLGALAVLAPGVGLEHANADLAVVSAQLAHAYPKTNHRTSFTLVGLRDLVFGSVTTSLWIVFVAVVGILLITCANVGNLLAAQWSSRDRELGVRRALGASTSRIATQLLIETGILAGIGAIFGIGLAYGVLQILGGAHGLIAQVLPSTLAIGIDGESLVYALFIVVVATLLAGLSPMAALGVQDLQSVLKSAGRGGDASRGRQVRATLVIVEIALALALVTVSGLMLRSLIDLVNTPLGIRTTGIVATAEITTAQRSQAKPSTERIAAAAVLARLRAVPGVDGAALATFYPESGLEFESTAPIFGQRYVDGQEPWAMADSVTPAYFRVFGERVVRGRTFTDADASGSMPVAVVNEAFVARFLQGRNPIGTRIRIVMGPTEGHFATIVGVVSNERLNVVQDAFGSPPVSPEYFVPLAQVPYAQFGAVAHSRTRDAATLTRDVQRAIGQALPWVPQPDTFTIAQRIAADTAQIRLITMLLVSLAVLALVLALCGIFGVVSFSVTQRTREFGVRISLGATGGAIVADVLRRVMVTTAIGVACGLVVAALAAHAIVAQLGTISPFDPTTFACVVALIFLAAMLAGLEPALRASRVEAAESLRYE